MLTGPRLRQVALAAADCDAVANQLQETFGWPEPFHDPGVGRFGLTNAVFAAGDTFVEVVAPVETGTTAGRYRERRGGDSGYMAIFQMPDLEQARRRVADAGIRVVWTADLADIAGTHLHPKDVPGAIVSLDWADPPDSWRWAGPEWTGQAPPHGYGGISGLTIEVTDPATAAARWASVLGVTVVDADGAAAIQLEHARQDLRFVRTDPAGGEGITEVRLSTEQPAPTVRIGGVWFVSTARAAGGELA
jgi:predicted enzyme related to lactoylglutathione lyase